MADIITPDARRRRVVAINLIASQFKYHSRRLIVRTSHGTCPLIISYTARTRYARTIDGRVFDDLVVDAIFLRSSRNA